MTHRRPEPGQAAFEQTLRRALRLAADSIEPAPDGLARIRTKIAARPAPAQLTGWAAWRSRYLTGLLAALALVAKYLDTVGVRLRYAFGAVVERFRPDSGVSGWIGWLRPAAALATTLLVVTGASWAIAGLPSWSPAGNSTAYNGGPGNGPHSSGNAGSVNGSSGPISNTGSLSPSASPSCVHSATANPTSSPLPSQGTGSPSSSPSPTSTSPSPSPTVTQTDTTSPSDSPSPTDTPGGQATSSPPGAPGSQSDDHAASADARTVPPAVTTPKPHSSLPPSSPSQSPCAG
ncbi:MAG: hypothetical protein LBV34_03975 [Nocardiopsaceae bacterium]|nr:hypothetical protein [Nocardiopsaceae bacterium]